MLQAISVLTLASFSEWVLVLILSYEKSFSHPKSCLSNNNNNNLLIYSALFNMLGDQKCITTINNLKTIQILKVYKYI